MKRTLSIALCGVMLFACVLFGCAKTDPFDFPASAQEEYARAYTAANGKAFDFTRGTVTVRQTITVDSTALRDVRDKENRPVYPATETREYLFDARNGIRSQVTDTRLDYGGNTSLQTVPHRKSARLLFAENTLCSPQLSADGTQSATAVFALKTYDSYESFAADPAYGYDTQMQAIAPYPLELFSSFTGGERERGKRYAITAAVDETQFAAFFELFMREYSFIPWYTEISGEEPARVYEHFLSPDRIRSVRLEVVTGPNGVLGTSTVITADPVNRPLYGIGAPITVTASTSYATEEFATNAIVLPPIKS